jgi:hypothetical protein
LAYQYAGFLTQTQENPVDQKLLSPAGNIYNELAERKGCDPANAPSRTLFSFDHPSRTPILGSASSEEINQTKPQLERQKMVFELPLG